MSESWRVDRLSQEWVGPITVTLTAQGVDITDDTITFAVLPKGTRPAADFSDFQPGTSDPQGLGGIGVMLNPVTDYEHLGIWARVLDNPEAPVLEPKEVGWIYRT